MSIIKSYWITFLEHPFQTGLLLVIMLHAVLGALVGVPAGVVVADNTYTAILTGAVIGTTSFITGAAALSTMYGLYTQNMRMEGASCVAVAATTALYTLLTVVMIESFDLVFMVGRILLVAVFLARGIFLYKLISVSMRHESGRYP